MTGTGDHVVHIGENAEILRRSENQFSGLLDLDEPIDTDGPAVTLSALSDAASMMDGGFWQPVVVDAHEPTDGGREKTLAFVNEDDGSEMIFVCPANPIPQEATA